MHQLVQTSSITASTRQGCPLHWLHCRNKPYIINHKLTIHAQGPSSLPTSHTLTCLSCPNPTRHSHVVVIKTVCLLLFFFLSFLLSKYSCPCCYYCFHSDCHCCSYSRILSLILTLVLILSCLYSYSGAYYS